MKRLLAAILFLAISVSLCIFEQYTVKTTYDKMNDYIESAMDSTEKREYEKANETCKEMARFWNGRQPYLTAMIEHTPLDETSITINSLEDISEEDASELQNTLITAKNQIKTIYNNQKITFGNIF